MVLILIATLVTLFIALIILIIAPNTILGTLQYIAVQYSTVHQEKIVFFLDVSPQL